MLVKLLVMRGYLLGILLWIVRIFHLRGQLLIVLINLLVISGHMRVSLVLLALIIVWIMGLLIRLVHFSAIKFIILNYNFVTASP